MWVHACCASWGWWWGFRQDDQGKPPGKEVVVSRPRERSGRPCWHTGKNICRGRSSRRRDLRLNLEADPGTWRLFTHLPILGTCCLLSQAHAAQGRRLETEPRGTLSISFYHAAGQGSGEPLQSPEQAALLPERPVASLEWAACLLSLLALRAWRQFQSPPQKLWGRFEPTTWQSETGCAGSRGWEARRRILVEPSLKVRRPWGLERGWGQVVPDQLIQTKLLLFSHPLPAATIISEWSKPGFPPEFAMNCLVHRRPPILPHLVTRSSLSVESVLSPSVHCLHSGPHFATELLPSRLWTVVKKLALTNTQTTWQLSGT